MVPLQLDALPVEVLGALAVVVTFVGALLRREYKRRTGESETTEGKTTHEDTNGIDYPPFGFAKPDATASKIVLATSNKLASKHGSAPANTAARQIHYALKDHDIAHHVVVSDASIDPPAEGTVGSGTPGWWKENGADELDTVGNANLLLVDQVGGGGTYGPWAVVGAGAIDKQYPAARASKSAVGDCLSAALHELLHVYGVGHDLDDSEGKQHTGMGWNNDRHEEWHRTPACVDNGIVNACGDPVEGREYDTVVQELYYTGCTVEHMDPLNHPVNDRD